MCGRCEELVIRCGKLTERYESNIEIHVLGKAEGSATAAQGLRMRFLRLDLWCLKL